jgi:hypothetical protein
MRVLFITNSSTQKCGVRVYGELWMDALRAAGVDVTEWDGCYQSIQDRSGRYLPEERIHLGCYDLLHLNWDPQAINHYLPEHFAPYPVPLSVFLHDVPPNSTCPVQGVAQLVMAHEPGEGVVQIDHAVPTYRSELQPSGVFTVGTAGIRDDPGVELVQQVCDRNGWQHSRSGEFGWLTTEEEIARLAQCHVNVCWYQTSGRGKSMAAMFMVAAGRPMVLSGSSMFSALWPYAEEFVWGRTHKVMEPGLETGYENPEYLASAIRTAQTWRAPTLSAELLSWTRCAEQIKGLWAEMLVGAARG